MKFDSMQFIWVTFQTLLKSTGDIEVRDTPFDVRCLNDDGSELSWIAKPSLIEKYTVMVDQLELALTPN